MKTLPNSIEHNLESQFKVPESFTNLYDAIIQAKRKTESIKYEITRVYYSFDKEFENRLTTYKNMYNEHKA